MITNEEIIREFEKGHKGEDTMEVVEASAEIQIALSQQKQEIAKEIEDSINLHKILKLNCKDNDKIEKKEAHDIVIEAFKKLKQNQTK